MTGFALLAALVALLAAPSVFAQADLEVSGVGPSTANPAETMDFTFTVTNLGPGPDPTVSFFIRPEFAYDIDRRFDDDCNLVHPEDYGLDTIGILLPTGGQPSCEDDLTDPTPWAFTPSQGSCAITREYCDCGTSLWPALHVRCDLGAIAAGNAATVDVSFPLTMSPPPEAVLRFHQPTAEGTWTPLNPDPLQGLRPANFGQSLYFGPATTADMMLANDGSGNPTWGCGATWVGDYVGKIALISRGSCEFGAKVVNAEANGAIGAVVFNDSVFTDPDRGGYIWMAEGVVGAAATIPAAFIPLEAGQALLTDLGSGTVNLTMGPIFTYPWSFDILAFTYTETNDPDVTNNAVSGSVLLDGIFADGFESGDTSGWSNPVP